MKQRKKRAPATFDTWSMDVMSGGCEGGSGRLWWRVVNLFFFFSKLAVSCLLARSIEAVEAVRGKL